jgi:hypothetical protein
MADTAYGQVVYYTSDDQSLQKYQMIFSQPDAAVWGAPGGLPTYSPPPLPPMPGR